MKRVKSLIAIFRFYDLEKSLIKIKTEKDKSIFFYIPKSNVVVLNGELLGEGEKMDFSLNHI